MALRRAAPRAPRRGRAARRLHAADPGARLAAALGLRELYIKVEGGNPTHSFKDRVVSVASAKAVELGLTALACPSTGNLAGAVAAQAAALGLDAYIFVPADLEREKIIAASVPGATVFAVEGNYDDVNRLCAELAYERPWAFVNVNVRSYYAQGSKTLAFETAEQLGWRLPGQIVAPIASGSLFHKVHKGYEQLIDVGLVEGELPRQYGAQAAGCAPVAEAWDAASTRCARSGPTRSPSRSRSARRPTAPTTSPSPTGPAVRSRRCPTTRSSRPSGSSPAHRHLHGDRRRRDRRHARAARRARAGSTPTPAPSPTSPATA